MLDKDQEVINSHSSDIPRIEIRGLEKNYGEIKALQGADLVIPSRGIYGLLGPNGAGKTTLISTILGLLDYDSGEILLDGVTHNPHDEKFKRKLGIVPQELAIYENLSAIDNLKFFGSLYGMKGSNLNDRAADLLKLTGLADRAKSKASTFSGGMKRRLNLACGIIHIPEVVLMDEPTVGIDPQSRNLIYDLVESLAEDGMTVLYTTHYMDEAERLCNRIAIIDIGKIVAEGTLDELIDVMGEKDIITLELDGDCEKAKFDNITADAKIELDDNILTLQVSHGKSKLVEIMNGVTSQGIEIKGITVRAPNLESVFLHLTGKELRD